MIGSLLDALPVELKLQVLINLDSKSLLRCASVSRSLYLTFRSSSLLRYIVQLSLYGMEDTGSNVPYPNLLLLIRNRQRAWERLEWKRIITIEVPRYCLAYELVAGVFASSDGQNLKIFGLPSTSNDGYTLTRTPNFTIRDFAIDPTEDVVAFLEESIQNPQRIHIRKISTNAPLSILTFTIPPDDNFRTPVLQFGRNLLGLHYASRILIWNWNQDSLIFDSSCESLPHHSGDFIFLSHDTFLVTSTSLHLYVLDPPSSVTLVATLHLPPIIPVYRHLTEITIHSGPLHGRPPSGVLFTPALSERIQVLSVKYGIFLKYTMFVHTSTLLQYVERYVNGGVSPNLVMHWHMWGPHNARFTKNDVPRDWLRYAHGQRMIQQHNTPSGTEIDVIDFNYVASSVLTDPPVNPFSSAGDNFRRTTFSRSQPTVFPLNPSPDSPVSGEGDSPFLTEVTTSLPYHVSSIRLPISFFACMIDDERIIGIQVDWSSGTDMKLVVYSF